jgi:spore coat polysaccharide biosynthesis protein SpsF
MKIGFLITARLKSTRLPKKLILKLNGREVIRHMLDRLKLSSVLDSIILCTSTNPQDKPLIKIAIDEGIDYFLGDEDDVILRLYKASKEFGLDYAINLTADCPLVSIEYIEKIVEKYKETNADLIRCLDLPHGFYPFGLKIGAMGKVCEVKKSRNTEVWGRYFTDTGLFNIVDLEIPKKYIRRDYRLTLDYQDDFKFFQEIFNHFGENTYKTSMSEIIRYLDENPQIVEINKHCQEMYKKRWESQNKLVLK